jgi:hypothetical protein
VAVIPYDIVKARMTLTEGEPPIFYVPEGNSQTFKKGELVTMASGYAIKVTTPAAAAVGLIYGVAAADASNNAGAQAAGVMVPVFLAVPSTMFEANMKTTALADYVSTAADVGTPMALQYDGAPNNRIALNAASKTLATFARVFVHGFGADSKVGDTNARMLFTFIPSATLVQGVPTMAEVEASTAEADKPTLLTGEGRPAREEKPADKPAERPTHR